MQINFTLRFSALLCMLAYVVLVVTFLGITGIFFHMQIHPEFYVSWDVTKIFSSTTYLASYLEKWNSHPATNQELFSVKNIKWYSLVINYLQILCQLLMIYLGIREFHKVIGSVESVETFHKKNIDSFRKIGQYMFCYFILSGLVIISAKDAYFQGYAVHYTPLILSVLACMMAEVFRQGNQLLDDNQLTI